MCLDLGQEPSLGERREPLLGEKRQWGAGALTRFIPSYSPGASSSQLWTSLRDPRELRPLSQPATEPFPGVSALTAGRWRNCSPSPTPAGIPQPSKIPGRGPGLGFTGMALLPVKESSGAYQQASGQGHRLSRSVFIEPTLWTIMAPPSTCWRGENVTKAYLIALQAPSEGGMRCSSCMEGDGRVPRWRLQRWGGGGGSRWMSVGPVPWWEGQRHQPMAFHSIPFPAASLTTGVLTGVVPRRKSCHHVAWSLSKPMV